MLIVGDIMQDLLNAIDRHIDIGGLNYYDVVDSLKSGETLSVIVSDIDKQSLRLGRTYDFMFKEDYINDKTNQKSLINRWNNGIALHLRNVVAKVIDIKGGLYKIQSNDFTGWVKVDFVERVY